MISVSVRICTNINVQRILMKIRKVAVVVTSRASYARIRNLITTVHHSDALRGGLPVRFG